MRLVRSCRAVVWVAALAALGSCGGNSPTVPSGVTRAFIVVTVSPNPLPAVITSAIGPVFTSQWKVKITESAGLGGDLQEVRASIFDDATGILVGSTAFDDRDLVVFVGTKRVEGGGILEIDQQLSYSLSASQTAAALTVQVRFKDDRGNVQDQALLVKIRS